MLLKLVRSFVCNTKRPSVKQSIKQQVSSNLADEPSLADGPSTSENSCLEYWYTILGR